MKRIKTWNELNDVEKLKAEWRMADWYAEMFEKFGKSKYDLDSEEAYAEMLADLKSLLFNDKMDAVDTDY